MIGWFPAPYPDETFDSICYRYAERLKYPHKSSVGVDLFGSRIMAVAVDVPRNLIRLLQQLPPGNTMTAASIFEDHSFLPYYRPFLRQETYDAMVAQAMGGTCETNILGALSKFRKHVPVYLRYCPECALKDRQQYGEAYWHRQHQLPGVQICPQHAVWLENSHVYAKHCNFSQGPVTAEEALQNVRMIPRSVDTCADGQLLLLLSRNSSWVLTKKLDTHAEAIFPKYQRALHSRGYLLSHGEISHTHLSSDLLALFPPDFLQGLKCVGRKGLDTNWAKRLEPWYYHNSHTSPLNHMLLIQFLSGTADEFFALPEAWSLEEHLPFGKGPWPCLNKACRSYSQPVIFSYQPVRGRPGPRGMFRCNECGYTYRRGLSEKTSRTVIYEHGEIWDARFRELWDDPSVILKTIGQTLGLTGVDTIKHHAVRLGLKFEGHRALILRTTQQRIVIEKISQEESVAEGSVSNELVTKISHGARRLNPRIVDLEDRDRSFSQMIEQAGDEIRRHPGKPVRVTRQKIGRRVGVPHLYRSQWPRLPKAKACLERVAESRDEFAIRRVLWARDYFVGQATVPTRWQLIQKAGVEKSLFVSVEEAVANVLAELEHLDRSKT